MSAEHIPNELQYCKTHEWIKAEGDQARLGITYHAQELLGDLVHVELPEVGSEVSADEEIGVVESVKAASDIFTPLSGRVTRINEDLFDSPELINSDPYGEGWLFELELTQEDELSSLLDASQYQQLIGEDD